MKVLVACEYSGRVRDAFIARGHDAMSCDLLPTEVPGPHHTGSVFDIIDDGWDLMVAHPPCTYLANSGVRWLYGGKGTIIDPDRWAAMVDGATFFRDLLEAAPIPMVAVENPVMHGFAKSIVGRGPDQWVQPWMFGHGEQKTTGLWLRGLPLLTPTDVVDGREQRVWKMGPSPERWRERSRTYQGIADAMAEQWGGHT